MAGAASALASGRFNDVNEIWDAIRAANQRWMNAYEQRDLDALAARYTEDAQSFAPDRPPVVGRRAIRDFWAETVQGPMKKLELHSVEIELHDTTAIEIGTSRQIGATDNELGRFRYLVVWKRQGGMWRIHREIWNSAPSAVT